VVDFQNWRIRNSTRLPHSGIGDESPFVRDEEQEMLAKCAALKEIGRIAARLNMEAHR
jgi:hypothetical protein